MRLPGINLSDFQPLSRGEWTMLAGQGLRFAFVKASEGKSFQAETFEAKWHDSKAAGLLRGGRSLLPPIENWGGAALGCSKRLGLWEVDGRP
jgi:GH25 family lysozyme M1 (1,4-beta-N-acetylmuramidase)